MGDPRKLFALDQTSSEKGVDIDYGEFSIRILPALETNPKYTAKLRAMLRKHGGQTRNRVLTPEQDRKIMAEVYSETVVVGWDNVTDDKDGKDKKIPFSPANVKALLLDAPLLFIDIREQASNVALFRADDIEETVKN